MYDLTVLLRSNIVHHLLSMSHDAIMWHCCPVNRKVRILKKFLIMPPSKEWGYVALHVSVGQSVRRPDFIRSITSESLHIRPADLEWRLVVYSRRSLLILRSVGQRTRSPCDQLRENALA